MLVRISVDIPDEDSGHFAIIPKDAGEWGARMKEGIENVGHLCLNIDTLAMGCGGLLINVTPELGFAGLDDERDFGFVVSKETAIEIRDALDLAIGKMEAT